MLDLDLSSLGDRIDAVANDIADTMNAIEYRINEAKEQNADAALIERLTQYHNIFLRLNGTLDTTDSLNICEDLKELDK